MSTLSPISVSVRVFSLCLLYSRLHCPLVTPFKAALHTHSELSFPI